MNARTEEQKLNRAVYDSIVRIVGDAESVGPELADAVQPTVDAARLLAARLSDGVAELVELRDRFPHEYMAVFRQLEREHLFRPAMKGGAA